jgi:hypothetical protein
MADVSGTPTNKIGERWTTAKLSIRFGITPDLSVTGMFRSARNRELLPTSPSDGIGLVGIYYRLDPTTRIGLSGGMQSRVFKGEKERGWVMGADLFFGTVTEKNYYLKKQMFGVIHIEKGQWDINPYIDARGMFPLISYLAVGAKYESDLGYGPHIEIKVPLEKEETMKAVYVYATYFSGKTLKTFVVGGRIAVN